MTEPEYIAYFEDLARKNRAISHSDDRPAFFVVRDNNTTELDQALRNKLNLPALLLDPYFDDLDTEHDNNRLMVQGGLAVICKVETGNVKSIRDARDEARRIARQFLNRVRRETRTPGSYLSTKRITMAHANQGEMTDVIGGGIASGWGYPFTLTMPTTVAVEPDDWHDLTA